MYNPSYADVAHLAERDLPKVDVASSSLVIRSIFGRRLLKQAGVRSVMRVPRLCGGILFFAPTAVTLTPLLVELPV